MKILKRKGRSCLTAPGWQQHLPFPPKQVGALLLECPQLLLWLHWAAPFTAEMAEVSGAHYLYNTTAEENRLFLRLPTAHTSRKNWTHCQQERRKVACPNPQAGMGMAESESMRAGGRKKNIYYPPPPADTELIDTTDCAIGSVSHYTHQWRKQMCSLCITLWKKKLSWLST